MSVPGFDLFLFFVTAALILFGFSAAFYVCFGPDLDNYKTLSASFFTLFRVLLGDFDYFELEQVDALMAPILFFSFIVFVFFVLLNMFLAIVNDSFAGKRLSTFI